MPSFYNLHVHLGETIFRGRCDGMNLWEYLDKSHNSYENHQWMQMEDRIHRLSGMITIMECLENGVSYIACNRGWEEVADMEIDASCSYPVVNIEKLKKFYDNINGILDIIKDYDNKKISTSLFLQSLYLSDVEKLNDIAKLMNKIDTLKLFVHIAETKEECDYVKEHYHLSPIQTLAKFGLLNEKTYCVHGIYVTQEDLSLIKEKGSNIILCPMSNLKLSDGYPNIHDYFNYNIPVSVATDGFATNNSASLLEELKLLGVMSGGSIDCNQLLDMITKNPARSIREIHRNGTIQEGSIADISIFETESYNLYDKEIIPNQIIYNHNAFHCQYVVNRGKIIYYNKNYSRGNLNLIKDEYTELLNNLF